MSLHDSDLVARSLKGAFRKNRAATLSSRHCRGQERLPDQVEQSGSGAWKRGWASKYKSSPQQPEGH